MYKSISVYLRILSSVWFWNKYRKKYKKNIRHPGRRITFYNYRWMTFHSNLQLNNIYVKQLLAC